MRGLIFLLILMMISTTTMATESMARPPPPVLVQSVALPGPSVLVSWAPNATSHLPGAIYNVYDGAGVLVTSVPAPETSVVVPSTAGSYGVSVTVDGIESGVAQACINVFLDPPPGVTITCHAGIPASPSVRLGD